MRQQLPVRPKPLNQGLVERLAKAGAALAIFWQSGALMAQPFAGPTFWSDPAPATYLVRLAGTELCVQRVDGGIPSQLPHLELRQCSEANFDQQIELAPNGITGTTATSPFPVSWRLMVRNKCLTAARGVVFGAPAIDALDCGTRDGDVLSTHMGAQDQTWSLRLMNQSHGKVFQITEKGGRCWGVVGSGPQAGAQVEMQPCANVSNVMGMFKIGSPIGDLTFAPNQAAAAEFGWLRLTRPLPGSIARYRALPGFAINYADDGAAIPTANDGGAACAQICVEDQRCRAFTWLSPAATGGSATCHKKAWAGWAEPMANATAGIVRPAGN